MLTKRRIRFLLWLGLGLAAVFPASGQVPEPLRRLDCSVMGEGDALRFDLSCELHNPGFEGARKDACLGFDLPFPNRRMPGRRMFAGLSAVNRSFNVENLFAVQGRYGIRFDLSGPRRSLYLTTALGAGLEYAHIDVSRLLESGSDPYLNSLAPKEVRFAGQAGISLHNDRFSVSVFSARLAQRFAESEVAVGAGWRTVPDRKVSFSLRGYGSWAKEGANAGFYCRVFAQVLFGRFLGFCTDYDSRNRLHAGASIHVKERFSLAYSAGFQAFRLRAGGEPFLSHFITLSFSFNAENKRENLYE